MVQAVKIEVRAGLELFDLCGGFLISVDRLKRNHPEAKRK